MKEYRFKLARHITEGDRLLVCSIWYQVVMAIDRQVKAVDTYRQLLLEVDGAKKTENTELIMLFPLGSIVKVKVDKADVKEETTDDKLF